jgi:hypothetical protein
MRYFPMRFRPRFRVRTLLILTALVAAGCYWWIARPTMVAERFVAALATDDRRSLESLWTDAEIESFCETYMHSQSDQLDKNHLQLRLLPRTWPDIWHRRRSIELIGIGAFKERAFSAGGTLVATNAGVKLLPESVWSMR